MPVLCLGEALVDLVCERPVCGLEEADSFRPRFGGMAANVAVVAARHGARVALAGGAGDDALGRWLRARLADERVDLEWFSLVPGVQTALALVAVDGDGEPTFEVYGDGIAGAFDALEPLLDPAVASCSGLFLGSNTLVGERERELTMRARARALELGRPVLFDPNLRLGRWPSAEEAVARCRPLVEGAHLLKCNRAEATLLSGEGDPERAAAALVARGARLVVVTLGRHGALLRGAAVADAHGAAAATVSTVGAGDTLMGVLVARLSQAGFDADAAVAALPEAVHAAARSTEHWGAVG